MKHIYITILFIALNLSLTAQTNTINWGDITVQNVTTPQFFSNIDNSGIDMTLTLSNIMNQVNQPVQDPFTPYIGEGRVLRIWKTSNPTMVSVTINFSEDINLEEFGFGGLRCYSGNCDNGKFTWYDGPNGTGNPVTPIDPLSYENINFDNSDPLNSNITITELDGTVPGGTTGNGDVSIDNGTYNVSGTSATCGGDCAKVYYIFNYKTAKVRSMVWEVTREPSGTPSQYLGGINFSAAPALPLELVSFKGENINGFSNKLSWSTASEVNVSHFELQKLSKGNYETIETVDAINGSNQDYSAIDTDLEFINFYRLTMVDRDGSFSHSNVIAVSAPPKRKKDVIFYPNPSSHEVFINFGKQINQGQIILRNQLGNPVYQSTVLDSEVAAIPVSNLPSGIYYLQSVIEGESIIKTISVQH